ncbi:glycoside hydrolase family 32 protein [Streptococcus suis]|uniref:Sucrose-6-phosphate hydrolase n=1 Tax=Streptococcus suis TaxID=1307 RepID=A0A0Z8J395_STRSU|nr:glycoside hydrolase family 32 protein [Streptococcus suis]NQG64513.1 glycoside hydrolase family 32 protein [Streptococcus suis]NQG66684.1 glycoside hydrolase family 32 protein [Streptococcus suis]CYV46471.1 Beta-fructosidases (levanase/invertase) [Streptococcus suis]CYV48737.1 Beta-fructosidases (levanase/invertase) [Streptococcus suis]
MKTVVEANQFIQTEKGNTNPIFKPQVHLTPETGWINDPNGFIYFRGEYHLFYQFNPYESVWGPMHWGHAKSKDLVNWEHLPVALAPDKDYDKDGCFSGSAIVKDDVLWLMYTGHINNEDGTVSQVQNMAFSTDGIHFEKIEQNPVATADGLPEEVIANDFRDPKIFEKDGHYYSVVATKHKDNVGCIVLLSSPNLTDWKFESIFLKGEANQGFVWECPDYFEVDGQEYLIISPMRYQKDGNDFININSNIFVTGHVDWDKKVFVAESFKEIDHGHDFYAAQTTESSEGERVMIAWMHTWGRPLVTNDLGHKWYGQMTLPRLLKQGENGLRQVLPAGILNSFDDIEIGQVIQGPSKLSLKLDDSLDLKLGTDRDYLQFGYDKAKQEVYIDRSSLKIQQVGEEEWSTVRRAVTVQATELEVLVDTNCLEIFINDGQETLTSTFYVEGQIILNAL